MSKVDMKVGDIIQIKGKKSEVVVDCGLREDKAYDGSYWCYEFTTVKLPKQNSVIEEIGSAITKTKQKEKHYYLSGYSMKSKGKEVDINDIKVVGECKINKKIQVSYDFEEVKIN